MKRKYKRRKFPVIDPSLQYKLLALIITYGFVTIVFVAIFIFLPDVLKVSNERLSMEVRAAAAERILTFHSRLWPSLIALVCILTVHSFRIFLKVIGPLHRLCLSFSRISQGDLSFRVKLRAKDYLIREAEMFNEMLDILSEKWGNIQSGSQDALESLSVLECSIDKMAGQDDSLRQVLQKHKENLEILADQSYYFKLITEEK